MRHVIRNVSLARISSFLCVFLRFFSFEQAMKHDQMYEKVGAILNRTARKERIVLVIFTYAGNGRPGKVLFGNYEAHYLE